MSSTDKSPNLALNQWAASDPVLREDFNRDNLILDQALDQLQRGLENNQKNTYNLILENDYAGKVTDYCAGISFDGFGDILRIEDSLGCGVDIAAKQLNTGASWFREPLGSESESASALLSTIHPQKPGVTAYLRVELHAAAQISGISLGIYPPNQYLNKNTSLMLDAVRWDNKNDRPTDQVLATSQVLNFAPSSTATGNYPVFETDWLLPSGIFGLRLRLISSEYTGTEPLYLYGRTYENIPDLARVHLPDGSLYKSGSNKFAACYCKFTAQAPELSGPRYLLSLPAPVEARESRIYVRHSGGTVSAAVVDSQDQSFPAQLLATTESQDLLTGVSCLESSFSCDLTGADCSAGLRTRLEFTPPGAEEEMLVYDYGNIWM